MSSKQQPYMVFLPSLGGGGAERAMILFCNELAARGEVVFLVCANGRGKLEKLVSPSVSLIDLQAKRMLMAIFRLRRIIKGRRPRAVFSTIVHANVATLIATCAMRDIKVIVRESNAPLSERKVTISRKVSHLLAQILYPLADAIVCVSEGVRNEVSQMCPSARDRCHVCATPVLDEALYTLAQEPLSEDEQELFKMNKTVVAVGRLHPQKNHALLLDAFALVLATEPDAILVILGEGALRAEIEERIKRLGLSNKVHLLGFRENPFPFMQRAALLALSSDYEGMPNVLIQSLGLGTTVVSTDCPSGPREVLRDGEWGYLVPVGDKEALANAICRALVSPIAVDRSLVSARYGVREATNGYLALQ